MKFLFLDLLFRVNVRLTSSTTSGKPIKRQDKGDAPSLTLLLISFFLNTGTGGRFYFEKRFFFLGDACRYLQGKLITISCAYKTSVWYIIINRYRTVAASKMAVQSLPLRLGNKPNSHPVNHELITVFFRFDDGNKVGIQELSWICDILARVMCSSTSLLLLRLPGTCFDMVFSLIDFALIHRPIHS